MNYYTIILAAGKGARLGIPKLRLQIDNESFLKRIYNVLKKIKELKNICIINKSDLEWASKEVQEFSYVINKYPGKEMLFSLLTGIKYIKRKFEIIKNDMIFLIHIDHPYVKIGTYKKLMDIYKKNEGKIIIPVYRNKPGHPVIFPYSFGNSITYKKNTGLNYIINNSKYEIIKVPVQDKGTTVNINTVQDLKTVKKT